MARVVVVKGAARIPRRLGLAAIGGLAAGAALGVWGLAPDASAGPPRAGWPPDPPVVPSSTQWVFTVRVRAGVPSIERVTSVAVKPPQGTPRLVGRYAIELWVGTELLDRVRFNVPLGGDGPPEEERPGRSRPRFDRVNTVLSARMADHPRATTLRLVDRATGEVQSFAWPWQPPRADAGADAGDADAGRGDAGDVDAGGGDAGDADAGRGDADAGDADAGAG